MWQTCLVGRLRPGHPGRSTPGRPLPLAGGGTAEGAITYGGDAPADALRGKDIDPGILSTDAVRRILDDYDVEALKQLLAECDAAGYDL